MKYFLRNKHVVPSFTYTKISFQFTLTKLQTRMAQEAHYYGSVRYDRHQGQVLKIELKIKHNLASEKHHQSHFVSFFLPNSG